MLTSVSAVCCSVLQCVAVCCSVLQCVVMGGYGFRLDQSMLVVMSACTASASSFATHCKTPHHTARHCKTLQDTARHCKTQPPHRNVGTKSLYKVFCKTLQDTARHCTTLQDTARHYNTPQHTAAHCNTLQHTTKYSLHTLISAWRASASSFQAFASPFS